MDNVVIRTSNPWNKGKPIGQRAPFKLKEIWAIRVRLQIYARTRELAMFDLGMDSKLRACDLVKLRVRIAHGDRISARAIVVQKKNPARVTAAPSDLPKGRLGSTGARRQAAGRRPLTPRPRICE